MLGLRQLCHEQEYQELEDESRRIIEELCFYAATQVNLLSSIGRSEGLSLEKYLSDREEHVARLKQEVSTVFRIKEKHRLLKVNWVFLQDEVKASLIQQEQVDKNKNPNLVLNITYFENER